MRATPAIRLEGGLFGPDILEALEQGSLKGQRPQDFGLDPRRNLTDEIAAAFADARGQWALFQRRLERLPEGDPATTATRDAWVIPFLGLLGYDLTYNPKAYEVDGLSFAISHRASPAAVDGPPVHVVGARQELGRVAPSGRPRLSPHALVQEYLNRTEHLWGLVTNGLTLRLLRDCTFVRRQAYAEFDLTAILEEQRFGDFALLYRLLHRTRLPENQEDSESCWIEQYYAQSAEQGGRVRDRLREGVEECLQLLANGFLSHEANGELRRRVDPAFGGPGRITPEELYRQLLRLVYRFLFLLVSEERGLISPDPLYREHYGILRLRRLLDSRASFDGHDDLWQSLRLLWKVLRDERLSSLLQVAPLNGELFAPVDLDGFTLSNHDLLEAFRHLAEYRDGSSAPPRRVNYAALDVEELGSVYESLLEYHPSVEREAGGPPRFSLVFGSERKTTGSYYTPPALVAELIQSALEPVLEERLRLAREAQARRAAILSLRVCDPACGSGHFLLAASRRLGKELARATTGEDEPSPEALREATREVIAHCLYGVDKNPLAVELCRVALWLESHTGGKPLTFLDHRIRCGDSLLGVLDLSVLAQGIPDKAFSALEGDEQEAARAALRQSRQERDRRSQSLPFGASASLESYSQAARSVAAIPDDSPETVRAKKAAYEKAHADPGWFRQKQACDLWTAAFFQPLRETGPFITSGALAGHLAGRFLDARLLGAAAELAERQHFFHWPLEFPEVFAAGGFDVVLSNPPWERIKLQEQEFFAARDAEIARAPTKAARGRLIAGLAERNPELHLAFREALHGAEAQSLFLRHSGRYPLTARGDINTYAVFAELARTLPGPGGRAGIIVPTGIATDDTTKHFFQEIVQSGGLCSLYDFENRKGIFPSVHKSYKFCLLTLARGPSAAPARLLFFALSPEELRKPEKAFTLSPEEFALLNPNTGNCPIFRSQADAELTKAIYRRVPVLWREGQEGRAESNPWRLSFSRMFDMANDSHLFRTREQLEAEGFRLEGNVFHGPKGRYLPLYE
ncbi:MAG: Eco57I restriction-modification methylase domain-containing protein, partial [Acidobacteriota bacterium]